jgi:hypothetical protein
MQPVNSGRPFPTSSITSASGFPKPTKELAGDLSESLEAFSDVDHVSGNTANSKVETLGLGFEIFFHFLLRILLPLSSNTVGLGARPKQKDPFTYKTKGSVHVSLQLFQLATPVRQEGERVLFTCQLKSCRDIGLSRGMGVDFATFWFTLRLRMGLSNHFRQPTNTHHFI